MLNSFDYCVRTILPRLTKCGSLLLNLCDVVVVVFVVVFICVLLFLKILETQHGECNTVETQLLTKNRFFLNNRKDLEDLESVSVIHTNPW